MRLFIVTPAPSGSTKGNRITAERWSEHLAQLGHETQVSDELIDDDFDCLICLHATRSRDAIIRFQTNFPKRPIVLCLTGTDLHIDLAAGAVGNERNQKQALESIDRCSRLVLLEPEGAKQLPEEFRCKVCVILQSATAVVEPPKPNEEAFQVCVLGHLRDEKDPFLTPLASQLLPESSRIQIIHLGSALNQEMEQHALEHMKQNSRYQWLGARSHDQAQRLLAGSRLMILSSKVEGAPSAISEAIVNGVPILASRIPAAVGLLGADYPGLFPVGDSRTLAKLMSRCESEDAFLPELKSAIEHRVHLFEPHREREALKQLLDSLTPNA